MSFENSSLVTAIEILSLIMGSFAIVERVYSFLREEYSKRTHRLIDPIFDDLGRSFNEENGVRVEETAFWVRIHKDSRKQRILQHLYTYKKKDGINLYDTYKELLKIQEKLRDVNPQSVPLQGLELEEYTEVRRQEKELLRQFAQSFSEIHEKLKRDSYPNCGACDDCLRFTRHDFFKYAYRLRKKKKTDPNAWDDSTWLNVRI